MSDHVAIDMPNGVRVEGDVLLVSEPVRAAGPDWVQAKFYVPDNVHTHDYVVMLVKLDGT